MKQIFTISGHSLNQGSASFNGLREELLTIKDKEILLKQLELGGILSGATPAKEEFDALLAELRDLKTKTRTAGILAT